MNTMTNREFLISLAQNDYMIDVNMLPDGKRLYVVAAYIEVLEDTIRKLQDTVKMLESRVWERGEMD